MDIHFFQEVFIYFLWLVLGITVHEWGHAWSAYRLGDLTPLAEGRITFNPLAHITFVGTICVPLIQVFFPGPIIMLGWGRPVAINPMNFKYGRWGSVLCSLAGPLCNFIFAFLLLIVGFALKNYTIFFFHLCMIGMVINISLGVFNLIPVPPLDGSRLFQILVGMSEETYVLFSQVGIFILLVLINLPFFQYYFSLSIDYLVDKFQIIGKFLFG
jgi:Zn-dependent protease